MGDCLVCACVKCTLPVRHTGNVRCLYTWELIWGKCCLFMGLFCVGCLRMDTQYGSRILVLCCFINFKVTVFI